MNAITRIRPNERQDSTHGNPPAFKLGMVTSHPIMCSGLGRTISCEAMETVIDEPGPINLGTLVSANWEVPLNSILELKHPESRAAGLTNHEEPIHLYVHTLQHPTRGSFLIDTGVSARLIEDPIRSGLSRLLRRFLRLERISIQRSTSHMLLNLPQKVSGVFLTHLHMDHIMGLPDIPTDVPIYVCLADITDRRPFNLLTQRSVDRILAGRGPILGWQFQADPSGEFDGVIDIFGDRSVFAILTPGHTLGSIAYLVRSTTGAVLLTGDACRTHFGWDHGVEAGSYTTLNRDLNLQSLNRLRALVRRHPMIEVRLGHQ